MFKYFLIFICLFSIYLFKYGSLAQKELESDIDNISYYLDQVDLYNHQDDIEYIKPCERTNYCRKIDFNGHIIGTCENYTSLFKRLGANRKEYYECKNGLLAPIKKFAL